MAAYKRLLVVSLRPVASVIPSISRLKALIEQSDAFLGGIYETQWLSQKNAGLIDNLRQRSSGIPLKPLPGQTSADSWPQSHCPRWRTSPHQLRCLQSFQTEHFNEPPYSRQRLQHLLASVSPALADRTNPSGAAALTLEGSRSRSPKVMPMVWSM